MKRLLKICAHFFCGCFEILFFFILKRGVSVLRVILTFDPKSLTLDLSFGMGCARLVLSAGDEMESQDPMELDDERHHQIDELFPSNE